MRHAVCPYWLSDSSQDLCRANKCGWRLPDDELNEIECVKYMNNQPDDWPLNRMEYHRQRLWLWTSYSCVECITSDQLSKAWATSGQGYQKTLEKWRWCWRILWSTVLNAVSWAKWVTQHLPLLTVTKMWDNICRMVDFNLHWTVCLMCRPKFKQRVHRL